VSKDTDEEGVSGMDLVNQSCKDSSIDGKKELLVELETVSEGSVFALVLIRERGLCLFRDIRM
jgi:hypothetical protein